MRCIIPSGEGVVTSVDTETLVTFWIGLKISIASSSINAKHSHLSVCLSRSRLSNGALLDIQKRMCLSLSPVEFGWMSRDRLFSLSLPFRLISPLSIVRLVPFGHRLVSVQSQQRLAVLIHHITNAHRWRHLEQIRRHTPKQSLEPLILYRLPRHVHYARIRRRMQYCPLRL